MYFAIWTLYKTSSWILTHFFILQAEHARGKLSAGQGATCRRRCSREAVRGATAALATPVNGHITAGRGQWSTRHERHGRDGYDTDDDGWHGAGNRLLGTRRTWRRAATTRGHGANGVELRAAIHR